MSSPAHRFLPSHLGILHTAPLLLALPQRWAAVLLSCWRNPMLKWQHSEETVSWHATRLLAALPRGAARPCHRMRCLASLQQSLRLSSPLAAGFFLDKVVAMARAGIGLDANGSRDAGLQDVGQSVVLFLINATPTLWGRVAATPSSANLRVWSGGVHSDFAANNPQLGLC